ncbi:MAG: hypothetical protein IBX64_13995, partial [Actinobacteria bacterium]|nr:hypothetical protein [Actinomycetota bacterium]
MLLLSSGKNIFYKTAQHPPLRILYGFILAMLLVLFAMLTFGTSGAVAAETTITLNSFTTDKASPQVKDTPITITADATGGTELYYK